MRKDTVGPSLAGDLHALAGLYASVFREMGRQARYGHGLPPHKHPAPPQSAGKRREESLSAHR